MDSNKYDKKVVTERIFTFDQRARNDSAEDHHTGEDTAWFPVLITEFAVIVIINAITITAFARIRHLRKRSTYLIINLTVADLLVGAITGPLHTYHKRKDNPSWRGFIILAFEVTFAIASQMNLCLISLDRLHATLFPFRHCLVTKCFYFKIVICSWLITVLLAFVMASVDLVVISYLWASFSIVTLLVLVVSYAIVILNVQKSPHSKNHGFLHTEKKLSVTLFIVTGVSILTILPWAIYVSVPEDITGNWQNASSIEINEVLAVMYLTSSIVNPLVYVIRMQEFRKAIVNLLLQQNQADNRLPKGRAEQNGVRR